jgi:hypothetical protein
LKTDIKLTTQQREWLQKNVIKSRRLTLKYRNEGHKAFRKAITSGKGNFYLALGENGAIYGALSYVPVIDRDGWTVLAGR